ncbi:MAG: oligosaccharide flippase family protein [Candidatus Paceibacterota bacterium]
MQESQHSTTRSIAQGTFVLSFFGLLTKFASFFTAIIVLRSLSIHEYGLSELSMTLFSFLGILLLPGISSVIIADMSFCKGQGNMPRAKEIFKRYVTLQSLLCIAGFIILFSSSFFVEYFATENVSNSLRILSFSFLISPFRMAFSILFSVEKKFFYQGMIGFFEEFFRLVVVLYIFVFHSFHLESVFLANTIGQASAMVFIYPFFLVSYKMWRRVIATNGGHVLESLFAHGKWAVFSTYLNTFGQNIRLWIIKTILGTPAVSIFSLAATLLAHTQSLFSLSNVLVPIISEKMSDRKLVNIIIAKSIKYQMIAFVIIGLCSLVFMPFVISLAFPKYLIALSSYKLLLVAMLLAPFAAVFTPMFQAAKQQKSLFKATFLKNISIVVFSIVLLPVFGVIGASIEYLITLSIYLFERYRVLKNIYPGFRISWKSFFLYDDVDRIIVSKVQDKLFKWI